MATLEQCTRFIDQISPYIVMYAKQYGYHVASAIIAQACCESAYGTSDLGYKYHNYFGLKCGGSWKGKSVNMHTREEYTPGTLTDITANFRVFDSMEEGVRGYFEFIDWSRYANLKNCYTPLDYLTAIKADGYATSSTYVDTNMRIIDTWNLKQFDFEKSHELDRQANITEFQLAANLDGFKDKNGNTLELDGIVGPLTQSVIDKVLLYARLTLLGYQAGSKGELVEWVQRNLNNKIMAKLDEDGLYGANTRKAVIKWQQVMQLKDIDGIVGKETINSLF